MPKEFIKFPITSIKTKEGLISLFEDEIKKLDEFTGDELLARIFGVILIFNNLSSEQKISIIDRIVKYLKQLKYKLDEVAKDWGVSDYSISVDVPWGIGISLTFHPPDE